MGSLGPPRLAVVLVAALALAALATGAVVAQSSKLRVTVVNVNGDPIGDVRMSETRFGTVDIQARLRGLEPGFHGFHIHAVGRCDDPDFTSAEGHIGEAEGEDHPEHAGDLSSLLVKRNGTATLRVTTDRFSLDDLRDEDGSAVMVHDKPENFANIPERYAPGGPDEDTLETGDAGDRVACGEIDAAD